MSPLPARQPPASPRPGVWRLAILLFVLAFALVAYLRRPRPGLTTLTYRIGQVDERFGLSREAFGDAIEQAVAVWAVPVERPLFRLDPGGAIEVNLIYDQRQARLDEVKRLNEGLGASVRAFEEVKAQYGALKAAYEAKRNALQEDFAACNRKVAAFNAENEALRRRGNASQTEVQALAATADSLKATLTALQTRQQALEGDRITLDQAQAAGNQVVAAVKAQSATVLAAGQNLTEAFDEGEYVRKFGRQRINIYAFANGKILVRVLAHELGHALGLGHGQDPQSIMYPQVQSEAWDLSPEDLQAIRATCGLDQRTRQ